MNLWIFTHDGTPLEHWMEGYCERFDAWHEGGVRGIVVGRLNFRQPDGSRIRTWAPDPGVYQARGENPPPAMPRDPDKERRLQAMLDDAASRGWHIMVFGAGSPALIQDLARAYPQVHGFIVDGPGENHYELAFHHGGELFELREGEERRFRAVGADLDRIRRGIASLRDAFHRLTPDRIRYHAPGGTLGGLLLFDIDEDGLYWLRQRQEVSRHEWSRARAAVDACDRPLELGGIPRTAAFSSLTGQNYQQMAPIFDYIFPKHYYWHRGFDGLYGTVARWVQRLRRWNPSLTERDGLLAVESLFGIRLPGINNLLDLELGFPPEFFDEFVYSESRRALEAVGGPDKVIFWVSTGRSPHAGDPMTARDLHGILTASQRAGARRFLFHPDPELGAPEWRVISSLCGSLWEEDRKSRFWPADTSRDTYSGSRQPPEED
jgi:hypothetical protein